MPQVVTTNTQIICAHLSAAQKNPPLAADAFRFTVPKGADVMKQ